MFVWKKMSYQVWEWRCDPDSCSRGKTQYKYLNINYQVAAPDF